MEETLDEVAVDARDDELSRAALMLKFLGFALSFEPDGRLLALVRDPDFLEAAPYAEDNPFVRRGMEYMRSWADSVEDASDDDVAKELKAAWFKAFVGVGRPIAPPWESVYTDIEHLMFADSTRDVRRRYRSFGFEPEKLNREPDDHIGLMMSFLSVLAEMEQAAAGDDERLASLRRAQLEFIEQHVFTFVDDWLRDVAEKVSNDFYAGVAFMVKGAAERRHSQLVADVAAGKASL